MQSANSEMMGRGGKAKSLLSCCFGVTKKHMEVLMELLQHQRGSVLTPPRLMALYLSVLLLSQWVGGRAWDRAGCVLGIPAQSSSDLRRMRYLHFVHQSDVASALGCRNLGGCLAAGSGFPAAVQGRSQHCPWCQRQRREQLLDPLPSPVCVPIPPSPVWHPPPKQTCSFWGGRNPQILVCPFPWRDAAGYSQPACPASRCHCLEPACAQKA